MLRITGVALALAGAAALSGCTGHGATAAGPQADDPGYVSPDKLIRVISVNDRVPAPSARGESIDGGTLDIHDLVGRVVVLNFWASWCPPCRTEQPKLNAVYAAVRAKGVDFLGVDVRDDKTAAQAFRRTHTVLYSSIVDESGSTLLGFRDIPASPPSTVIIDRDGRIAAKIIGGTPSGVLQPIIDQIAAEGSSSS